MLAFIFSCLRLPRRWLFYLRLFIGSLRYAPVRPNSPRWQPSLQRLNGKTIAKHSNYALHEAAAMKFVRNHTSIPVPRVHGVYPDIIHTGATKETGWITMDYVDGVALLAVWEHMSEAQKSRVGEQLKDFFTQLRSLPQSHPGRVCSLTGEALVDCRLKSGRVNGPFSSVESFHDYLFTLATRNLPPYIVAKVPRHRNNYEVVFTHADIHGNHIILDRDDLGKVIGIIDWETAGWFPEYWEFTRATQAGHAVEGWLEIMSYVVGDYREEEATEWRLIDFQGAV